MNIKNKTIASMQGIALDAINKVGQGHIGMAIGAAPITYSLIGENLNFSKENPRWINRDRFVMSAGHGSMAMYSIMHFLGLLSKEDIQNHKTLHSKTPSHPERDAFEYVDASTGPLGQGVAMGVGMAISKMYLSKKFNKANFEIFNHKIFVLVGDGCLQEGVALESIQLAGTLKLNDLIIIQDYNNVQIDSLTSEVNNIDMISYFKSNNFNVIDVKTTNDDAISKAIKESRNSNKPTFIRVSTKIATNTPYEGKSKGHNGVLTVDETIKFKEILGLEEKTPFVYDDDVYKNGEQLLLEKDILYKKYLEVIEAYQKEHPKDYEDLEKVINNSIELNINNIVFPETNVATRNYFVPILKELENKFGIVGGSADLAAATKIKFNKDLINGGQNIKYGIREHAMVSINNGIYLHSGLRTIDATFLTFSDYAKAGYRMGSLMKIPSLHILTHDSYEVGGDGPTHQPFDQLPMLRSIQDSIVIRPCDENEMILAFNYAFKNKDKQCFIIACRQPVKSFNKVNGESLPKAYKVYGEDDFDLSIIATGSEVSLAVDTAIELEKLNISIQVISAPLLKEFTNDVNLIKKLKVDQKPIFALEASNDNIWYRFAQFNKFSCHLANGYGYSAPGPQVYALKGFNKEKIANKIKQFLNK